MAAVSNQEKRVARYDLLAFSHSVQTSSRPPTLLPPSIRLTTTTALRHDRDMPSNQPLKGM